jgi:hypothetical protein
LDGQADGKTDKGKMISANLAVNDCGKNTLLFVDYGCYVGNNVLFSSYKYLYFSPIPGINFTRQNSPWEYNNFSY